MSICVRSKKKICTLLSFVPKFTEHTRERQTKNVGLKVVCFTRACIQYNSARECLCTQAC